MLNRLFLLLLHWINAAVCERRTPRDQKINLTAQKPPQKPDSNGKPASRFFIGRGLAVDSRNKL